MTPEEKVQRAERAQRLREDKLLAEAFAGVRAAWLERFEASAYADTDTRERAYHHLAALNEVCQQLLQFVQDGKIAKAEIEARKKQ